MKKLSLYIFLVLMFCNVGFANQKIYGGKSAELVYSCTTETWGNEEIPFAFSYIDDLFAKGAWIVHSYDYQKNENGPAISELVEIDIGFSWVEAHEDGFYIFLLQYKENDLKSDINNKINHTSIGYLYSAFTSALGFIPNSDEGKVEALAAFGKNNDKLTAELSELVDIKNNSINLHKEKIIKFYDTNYLKKIIGKIGRENFAYCIQNWLEKTIINYLIR